MNPSRKVRTLASVLVLVAVLAGCGAPQVAPAAAPTPMPATATPVPPMATTVPPTATPVPPTQMSASAQPTPTTLLAGAHATDPTAETPWDRYLLLFMIAPSRPQEIASFVVMCDGVGLPNADGLMQAAVLIKDNGFTIENADIQLTAHIVDSAVITGTISARSEAALECGIPTNDDWRAVCDVETGLTGLWLHGEEVPQELISPCSAASVAPTPSE